MNGTQQLQSLLSLAPQVPGTVLGIDCRGPIRRRLMDMGITPGAQVVIEGAAPLGDPLIVWVRGCRLALRRTEAAHILVAPSEGHGYAPAMDQWTDGRPQRGRHRQRRRGHGPRERLRGWGGGNRHRG
ncbi:MAG: ferrous iron transport protein A [Firmicutes bacterium]|nr:ferrous iron transport protein A [Bacillota bacterium]